MKSAFDPRSGAWQLGWPGRVSRHDLVYLSPPEDPTQGIPLGNGDIGALAWCEPSRLVLALNKCDLWDDASLGKGLRNWAPEQEERSPTQRHAGRLILDFGLPVFDPFYLRDFTARLSLADATMSLSASGPLGKVELRCFVGHAEGLLCAEVSAELSEALPLQVLLERWGSRTFGHWYSQVARDPTVGLAGTEAHSGDDIASVTHRLTTGSFALSCRVESELGGAPESRRLHSHAAELELPAAARRHFTLFATVTSPAEGDPLPAAASVLAEATRQGIAAIESEHSGAWKEFWLRSLMESGDDYLDNLWHLTQYYAAASQRGKWPGRFIFGLWGWNRDVQHWTFFFHWNQQELYWPLNAAGHHELVSSYLEYRFGSLGEARADARERLGVDGAVVSDVADWRGRNSVSELENHTPVAQIALDFWRQYRYTGDRPFLRDRALPYLLEAATFFATLFDRESDGRYHARKGTGYEGWIRLRDGITELACARALFTATLDALALSGVAHPLASRFREILDNLAPLPAAEPEGCFTESAEGPRYARGAFKGRPARGRSTHAAGWGIDEKKLLCSKIPTDPSTEPPPDPFSLLHLMEKNETPYSAIREDMRVYDGIFPFVEYSAVFPSGVIGLADRGSEEYARAANTALLYSPDCMGWDPLPIVLARLGLREELATILASWPSRWQYHCNGFGHYGPRDIQKAEATVRFRTNRVRDAAAPRDETRRFPFAAWPFRHMGMESMSVLAAAMNESLLQSHDGTIRVAPAAADRGRSRFTLHAAGGFVVSSELAAGKPLWVSVQSRLGGECVIENPWPEAYLWRGSRADGKRGERLVRLPTAPGESILLAPHPDAMASWEVEPFELRANDLPKSCALAWAQLGLPRMF